MIKYIYLLLLLKISIGYRNLNTRISVNGNDKVVRTINTNLFTFNDVKELCNSYISSNKKKIQALDYTSLNVIVSELANIIIPSKVENVIQDDEHSIYLGIRTNSNKNLWLQLCWDNSYSRICLNQPSGNIGSGLSYSFGTILRTLLRDL